jgi:hypothetical protein
MFWSSKSLAGVDKFLDDNFSNMDVPIFQTLIRHELWIGGE